MQHQLVLNKEFLFVGSFDCYADIALTGLVLRRVSGKVVRVGWKFIPRENLTYIDVVNASMDDSEWDLVSPAEFFRSEDDELEKWKIPFEEENDEESDQQTDNEGVIPEGDFDIIESWTLRTAFMEATMRRWKSRWLRLDRNLALKGSGMWQCWLEGIDLYTTKSTTRGHMLVTEVHVHVLPPQPSGSEEGVDTWRAIAIWTVPICMILLFLIALTAWTASIRWHDLLYHPPMKPKKHEDKKKGDDSQVDQKAKLDYSELEHLHADRNVEVFNFNSDKFIMDDLKRLGVPSRKDKGGLIW
nr:hypothetical protein HmN_000611900 [Hymenolepis microstoma]